jgi:hypothetical protein
MAIPIRSITLGLILISSCSIFGQHVIDLSEQRLSVSGLNAQVDSVIVAFSDTAAIGIVMSSIFNERLPAHLNGPIGQQLGQFIHAQLPATSSARHVVLKLNRLRITEQRINGTEAAFAGMNIEFLRREGDDWVREYVHGTTTFSKSLDATHLHAANIANALNECLQGYAYANWTGTLSDLRMPQNELMIPVTPEKLHLQILTQGKPRNGIYHTFMDMANNTPSTNIPLRMKEVGEFPQQRELKVTSDSAETIRRAWGLCSEGRVYVNNGKRFVELQRDITGFHLRHLERVTEINEGEVLGFTVGNALAMVLFGSAMGGIYAEDRRSAPFPERLDLDMLTGQLVAVKPPPTGSSRTSETLFVDRTSEGNHLQLLMFGGEEAVLAAGQHHWIRLVPREAIVPIDICVINRSSVRIKIDTNEADKIVYVVSNNDDGTIRAEQLDAAMAKDLLQHLRSEDEIK